MLFDPLPRLATVYQTNMATIYGKQFSNLPRGRKSAKGPNYFNLSQTKFCLWISLAYQSATFLRSIIVVVLARPDKEMSRVYARRIVTAVKNMISWPDPGCEKIAEAVGSQNSTIGLAPNRLSAIAVLVEKYLALPTITARSLPRRLVYVFPKSGELALRQNRRSGIGFRHGLKSVFRLCRGSFNGSALSEPCLFYH